MVPMRQQPEEDKGDEALLFRSYTDMYQQAS